jgi:hypothetical protein
MLEGGRRSVFPGRGLAGAIALAITISGCASYQARPLDTRQSASAVIEQHHVDGLYVAVKDISKARDSLQVFDRDMLDAGYVPVLVLLELDRASNAVYDVRREDIQLCLRDGMRLACADTTDVVDRVAFTHLRSVFGFLLVFPGFFIAPSVSSANEELEADYRAKSMVNVRINPNLRSLQAVVFFPVPEEAEEFTLEDAFVEFKVYRQAEAGGMGKWIEFPVQFSK